MDYDLNKQVALSMEHGVLPSLDEQFSYWTSHKELSGHDLTIKKGRVESQNLIRASNDYSFFDGGFVRIEPMGKVGFKPGEITVEGTVDESRLEAKFLMPGINQILLHKGWCLAHASAIIYQGNAIIFPAMGGTGKTAMMLELLSRGADFMSDDHIMVGQEGEMALYPRWIHMMEYNWTLYPELFEKAFPDKDERKEQENILRKYRRGLKMKGGNPVTRWLKGHYTSYYYYDARVRPERMFPESKVALSSKVRCAFFLEKCDAKPSIIDSSPTRLARLTVSSSEMESGGVFGTLSTLAGIEYLDYSRRTETMRRFFEHAKCFEVRMKGIERREDASRAVEEIISFIG
jgi:hypothetical protein